MAGRFLNFGNCTRKCGAFERLTVVVPIKLARKMSGDDNDAGFIRSDHMPNCESRRIMQRYQHFRWKTSKNPNGLARGPSGADRVVECLSGQLVEVEDNLVGVDVAFQQNQYLNVY